jgi:hypothetical protein
MKVESMNFLKLHVHVTTRLAEGNFEVMGETLTDAFSQIPLVAAEAGLALVNDDGPVNYSVEVRP